MNLNKDQLLKKAEELSSHPEEASGLAFAAQNGDFAAQALVDKLQTIGVLITTNLDQPVIFFNS